MKSLDDRALTYIADYFRALSEPLRLKALNALRERPRNVSELTALLGCSQANASKHLATLARHGLVSRQSQGTNAYYEIADPRIYQLCDIVCGQLAENFAASAQLLGHVAAGRRPAAARAATARVRR